MNIKYQNTLFNLHFYAKNTFICHLDDLKTNKLTNFYRINNDLFDNLHIKYHKPHELFYQFRNHNLNSVVFFFNNGFDHYDLSYFVPLFLTQTAIYLVHFYLIYTYTKNIMIWNNYQKYIYFSSIKKFFLIQLLEGDLLTSRSLKFYVIKKQFLNLYKTVFYL